ncbi:hypothetical protein C8J57DRAFT_1538717 [Mycena rebaudengoi]|nr:hypothetical protein C8J57DRAFT_1538717 [Mycena rebaudengoi]
MAQRKISPHAAFISAAVGKVDDFDKCGGRHHLQISLGARVRDTVGQARSHCANGTCREQVGPALPDERVKILHEAWDETKAVLDALDMEPEAKRKVAMKMAKTRGKDVLEAWNAKQEADAHDQSVVQQTPLRPATVQLTPLRPAKALRRPTERDNDTPVQHANNCKCRTITVIIYTATGQAPMKQTLFVPDIRSFDLTLYPIFRTIQAANDVDVGSRSTIIKYERYSNIYKNYTDSIAGAFNLRGHGHLVLYRRKPLKDKSLPGIGTWKTKIKQSVAADDSPSVASFPAAATKPGGSSSSSAGPSHLSTLKRKRSHSDVLSAAGSSTAGRLPALCSHAPMADQAREAAAWMQEDIEDAALSKFNEGSDWEPEESNIIVISDSNEE